VFVSIHASSSGKNGDQSATCRSPCQLHSSVATRHRRWTVHGWFSCSAYLCSVMGYECWDRPCRASVKVEQEL